MNDVAFDSAATVKDLLKSIGIQKILDLPGITEVAINNPGFIWFDRGNGWEFEKSSTVTLESCYSLAKALAVYAGHTIPLGVALPMASVVLPNEERGQIAVYPVTKKDIVSLTFRKPSLDRFTLSDYENSGRFSGFKDIQISDLKISDVDQELLDLKKTNKIADFFALCVKSKKNILLAGGTGSGKTTVMKALVDLYPTSKRIFTIEDVNEITLPNHPNHINMFYKQGGATPKQVIESCMRMKPCHIFLAELRGDEAWSYLEALNTGHQGSVTTIHANDCVSAYSRLATLIKQSPIGITLDHDYIMKSILKSIDVVAYFEGTYLKEISFDPYRKIDALKDA